MIYYERYIGSITVLEFVKPFLGKYNKYIEATDSAIQTFIFKWVYEDPIPDDFYTVVYDYCLAELAKSNG